jgi:hypothetical protein
MQKCPRPDEQIVMENNQDAQRPDAPLAHRRGRRSAAQQRRYTLSDASEGDDNADAMLSAGNAGSKRGTMPQASHGASGPSQASPNPAQLYFQASRPCMLPVCQPYPAECFMPPAFAGHERAGLSGGRCATLPMVSEGALAPGWGAQMPLESSMMQRCQYGEYSMSHLMPPMHVQAARCDSNSLLQPHNPFHTGLFTADAEGCCDGLLPIAPLGSARHPGHPHM